ncbi:MAG TPA: TlpA disulfide reductase family protein [Candidatus Angelobacter sp.]|nr:TlpA disulfide reductase family protein [Candidatus Angelobacter sp.]
MNRNVVVVLCVVVVITGLLLVGKRASKPRASVDPTKQNVSGSLTPSGTDPAIGSLAPEFSLKSVPDGKTVTLSSLRGKAVVVNFWATWCGPCKIEMPWLVDLQKKYGDQGLQIVGITKEDYDEATIARFTKKMGVNYTILVGNQQVLDLYGGVGGLPTSFFVDRSGKVVHEIIGLDSESKFEDAIKQALL